MSIQKSPILKPDDLKGIRYRVSASLSSRYFAEAIGADLIPMGYGEIVQSLQTDLITAGDNSIALYVKTGKEQEAPHYTLTQHSLGMSVMVAGKDWWNNLTPEQQEAIESSWPDPKKSKTGIKRRRGWESKKCRDHGELKFIVYPRMKESSGSQQRLVRLSVWQRKLVAAQKKSSL